MEDIAFFKPLIDDKEIELIKEVLQNNDKNIAEDFEKDIVSFFKTKGIFAVSTNNATSAVHLALCAMDIKRGDKIICSVNSFPNVAETIRHFDAEPIFVDINENDYNMNPDELEKVIKIHNHKKLKGIFINHIGGNAANLDRIYDIAKTHKLKVFDDATRALGLKYKGKKVGTLNSYFSVFQINPQEQNSVSTAGFFITKDEELAKRAKLLRNNAIIQSSFDKNGNISYIYDVVDIGQKCDLNGINAAFAKAQLSKNDYFIKKRREIAKKYYDELKDCPHITLPEFNEESIFTQFIIRIDKNRDGFAKKLGEAGIYTSLHYTPIHLLSYFKNKYSFRVNDFPNALKIYQQILSIPLYAALDDEQIDFIIATIKQIAKNRV